MDWFRKYKSLLVEYLEEGVPRWQSAPKTWDIAPPANVWTETVVGARLAKQEKTQRMKHSGQLYDVELGYYDRQLSQDHFALHPPCEQRMVVPLDARLLKMVVFLFEVEQMYDPPHHALYDNTMEEGPRSTV